jgi:predicted dehydrogenase
MKKIRIGVASFEHMHAKSYTRQASLMENVELVGIYDGDEYRGTEMASLFHTTYYSSYDDLLDAGLDGVIICTNNRDHAPFVVKAAARKVNILVEKPFAVNLEDAEAMLSACKENGVRIMNAFPLRFNPNIIEAKKEIDEGKIGNILCITGINHGKIPSGWFLDRTLSGGGGIMDHTVHLADLIRWFSASEYKNVYCEGGCLLHDKGIDDTGLVMAEMENGVFATIDCSWAHHANYPIWPQVDMEIIGTKGVLEVKAFAQVNHYVDEAQGKIEDISWDEGGDEGLVREFVDVCATGREPLASGLDGARALEVTDGAYRSLASHKKEEVRHVRA